jgi:hypothetical protein
VIYYLTPARKRWLERQAVEAETVSERGFARRVLARCQVVGPMPTEPARPSKD